MPTRHWYILGQTWKPWVNTLWTPLSFRQVITVHSTCKLINYRHLNPALWVDQYLVPSQKIYLHFIQCKEVFWTWLLTHIYASSTQVWVSQYFTTNSHKGLYQHNRLSFGVTSAPAVFKQTMVKILQDLYWTLTCNHWKNESNCQCSTAK